MNEWYLRDLSRKQKTAIRVKGESGKPTTNCAIYGYKKDPENKYHWLIDEEAAAVVRRIGGNCIERLNLSCSICCHAYMEQGQCVFRQRNYTARFSYVQLNPKEILKF